MRFVLALDLQIEGGEMADEVRTRARYGEAFWRVHHEAWKRSELNLLQCCEAQGIPLKAVGNWRARFKAEPQPPERSQLLAITTPDKRAEDMADLVSSASRPGLKDRIAAYRARG